MDKKSKYAPQERYRSSGKLSQISVSMKKEEAAEYKAACDRLGIRYTAPMRQAIADVISGKYRKE